MNCDSLQANLYEYLDDTLSPSAKAAAEKHLADCSTCRETVQRERQREQALARKFNHAVKGVELDALARRNLAAAIAKATAPAAVRPGFWDLTRGFFSGNLVRPFATAALLVASIAAGIHFLGKAHFTEEVKPTPTASAKVQVDLTYSVPGYVFRKDGNQVIDALTSDTLDADAAFLVNN